MKADHTFFLFTACHARKCTYLHAYKNTPGPPPSGNRVVVPLVSLYVCRYVRDRSRHISVLFQFRIISDKIFLDTYKDYINIYIVTLSKVIYFFLMILVIY